MTTLYRTLTLKDGRELILRSPCIDDAEAMIDLVETGDMETRFLGREPGEFNIVPDKEREVIEARTSNPRSLWLVAELEGKIVASCDTTCVRDRNRFRHRASMGIMVLKAYWQLGIGRALMQACIAGCREMGYEQLELEVVSDNSHAIALYESLGFINCGRKPHSFKYPDGSYADNNEMYLFL